MEAVNQKEEQQWKEHMMQKTKLITYRTIKQTLTFEQYLNSKDSAGADDDEIERRNEWAENRDRKMINIQSQTETEDWK